MNRLDLIRAHEINRRNYGYNNSGPLIPLKPPPTRWSDRPSFAILVGAVMLALVVGWGFIFMGWAG